MNFSPTTYNFSTTETFPKRLRSASARLFPINTNPQLHKRGSYQLEPSVQSYSAFNPSSWFPRIRNRSSSSNSSTFSTLFTPSPTDSSPPHYFSHSCRLDCLSSELEELYNNAKIEIDFAIDSQGSIYYEGDYSTAHLAFNDCQSRYESCMQSFGDTANSIKFRFRWESDITQLQARLNTLPLVTHSIYD
ncbi:hypothetical protein G6F56_004065 [Rhizopus delemar]|nr:hypothetical protein G6F56_004065 [Rhizopus delemar]